MAQQDSRYNTGNQEDLSRIIADLRRRVENLESGARVGFTSIDSGALEVNSGVFTVGTNPQVVYFGPVADGIGGFPPGFVFRRANGALVFDLEGAGTAQYWALRDEQNNNLMSDDSLTGQGLARPYIPLVSGVHYNKTFSVTTTNASFEGMYIFRFSKQHPQYFVDPMVKCSDGTTAGEIQIYNNVTNEIAADPVVVPAGALQRVPIGPFPIAGNHMDDCEFELQARRTAGVGTIGIEIYGAYGRQS